MALGTDVFTIADAARAQGYGMVAKLLEERLDLTPALPAVKCNSGDTHVGSLQTRLPETFVRRMNQGVPSSMGSKASIRFNTYAFENRCEIDIKQVRREYPKYIDAAGGDRQLAIQMYRAEASEDHQLSMAKRVERALIYGLTDGPQVIHGIRDLMNDANSSGNSRNVIYGGSKTTLPTGKSTSIYLLTLSPKVLSMLYPAGSKPGFASYDEGEQTATTSDFGELKIGTLADSSKNRREHDNSYTVAKGTRSLASGEIGAPKLRVLAERFEWDLGLALLDWRGCGRATANSALLAQNTIDASATLANTPVDLIDLIRKLDQAVESVGGGRKCLLMNVESKYALEAQVDDSIRYGGSIQYKDIAGKSVMHYREYPVLISDQIPNYEDAPLNASSVTDPGRLGRTLKHANS